MQEEFRKEMKGDPSLGLARTGQGQREAGSDLQGVVSVEPDQRAGPVPRFRGSALRPS